jgi:hypothetical protein
MPQERSEEEYHKSHSSFTDVSFEDI